MSGEIIEKYFIHFKNQYKFFYTTEDDSLFVWFGEADKYCKDNDLDANLIKEWFEKPLTTDKQEKQSFNWNYVHKKFKK